MGVALHPGNLLVLDSCVDNNLSSATARPCSDSVASIKHHSSNTGEIPEYSCVSHPVYQVELCEALRRSVAALRQEKEALCEEQKCHQALGASMETLVQERLKTNERDKYSMFIGTTSDCHCKKTI